MSGTTASLELYTCMLDVRGLKSSRVTCSGLALLAVHCRIQQSH